MREGDNQPLYFILTCDILCSSRKKDQLLGLISVLEKCKDFKHLVLTGDLNCKSLEWNNNKSNTCGVILEEYLHRSGLLCMNDGLPTGRLSESVIDLFIVSPKVVSEIVRCETLSQDRVRSDHIGVLLLPRTGERVREFGKIHIK